MLLLCVMCGDRCGSGARAFMPAHVIVLVNTKPWIMPTFVISYHIQGWKLHTVTGMTHWIVVCFPKKVTISSWYPYSRRTSQEFRTWR
jgi:hypothetical protein